MQRQPAQYFRMRPDDLIEIGNMIFYLILIGVYSGAGRRIRAEVDTFDDRGWLNLENATLHRRGTNAKRSKIRQPPARIMCDCFRTFAGGELRTWLRASQAFATIRRNLFASFGGHETPFAGLPATNVPTARILCGPQPRRG